MTLMAEETVIEVDSQRVCLCHGDALCTDDKQYQRFRSIIRNPFILGFLKKLPKQYRLRIARKLRNNSKQRFANNPVYIDVTEQAVIDSFKITEADYLVHGHTHMADIHYHSFNEQKGVRFVLGDWDKVGWYLELDNQDPQLVQFSIDQPVFNSKIEQS